LLHLHPTRDLDIGAFDQRRPALFEGEVAALAAT